MRNFIRVSTFLQKEKHASTMSEEASECAEEPEQRLPENAKTNVLCHERIRIFVCVWALLFILLSFFLFLSTGTSLPLFAMTIVLYLLSSSLDNYLRRTETEGPCETACRQGLSLLLFSRFGKEGRSAL